MKHYSANSTGIFALLACAVFLASSGCWQKIEYDPAADSAENDSDSPSKEQEAAEAIPGSDRSNDADPDDGTEFEPREPPLSPNQYPTDQSGQSADPILLAENSIVPFVNTPSDEEVEEPAEDASEAPVVLAEAETETNAPPTDDIEEYTSPDLSFLGDETAFTPVGEQENPTDPTITVVPLNGEEPVEQAESSDNSQRESEVVAQEDEEPGPEFVAQKTSDAAEEEVNADDSQGDQGLAFLSEPTAEQRRAIWQAAGRWSLAAAMYASGADEAAWQRAMTGARDVAREVALPLPALPLDEVDHRDAVIRALSGSSDSLGEQFALAVEQRFNAQEAASARLAMRAILLLLVYTPQNEQVSTFAPAIQSLAMTSSVSDQHWRPLVTLLERRADFNDVKRAVFKLQRDAARPLRSVGYESYRN